MARPRNVHKKLGPFVTPRDRRREDDTSPPLTALQAVTVQEIGKANQAGHGPYTIENTLYLTNQTYQGLLRPRQSTSAIGRVGRLVSFFLLAGPILAVPIALFVAATYQTEPNSLVIVGFIIALTLGCFWLTARLVRTRHKS